MVKISSIYKSKLDKLVEFLYAILIIHDSLEFVKEEKTYHIITIYGQLRALLTDKSLRKQKKRLFEIAQLLDEEITIFYMPNTLEQDLPFFKNKLSFHFSSPAISLHRKFKNQELIKLSDFLNIEIAQLNGNKFTPLNLIDTLSNKLGGSHYAPEVQEHILKLKSYKINNTPLIDDFILNIASIVRDIGVNFTKKISELDFFLMIYLESTNSSQNSIFEFTLPNANCNLSLGINNNRLCLLLQGLINKPIRIDIDKDIPIKEWQTINIAHQITNNLESIIVIYINGIEVNRHLVAYPIAIINEISHYSRYFNKSIKGTTQELEFRLGDTIFFSNRLSDEEREKCLNFLKIKRGKCYFFRSKSFGYSHPNREKGMELNGNIEIINTTSQ